MSIITWKSFVYRWRAPISLSLFAPGDDFEPTVNSILYTRNCLANSDLIKQFVTFHIYFPKSHIPNFLRGDAFSEIPYNCPVNAPYVNVDRTRMYKNMHKLTYPINVGRNIARKAANTHFVFPCDIELYPSMEMGHKFLEMIAGNTNLLPTHYKRR